jgi:hypothetical protein
MITSSFNLTATERVLPRLALNFTTASLDSRVTFTRTGNTATVINSSGNIVSINANLPRFDFDPTTLICRGLLIEEARANALLNSLIDGTDLATQSVTVTAAARTLSFYGTGTVVLSGTHSATVVGTGAYPARTTLTFTPSAGSLTLTVTGTVQFAQLEAGAFATSFIPTAAAAVTRNADVATMTGANFSSWYNTSEGTFNVTASTFSNVATDKFIANANAGGFPNRFLCHFASANNMAINIVKDSVSQVGMFSGAVVPLNTMSKATMAAKLNSFAISRDGLVPTTSASGLMPVGVDRLWIGSATTTAFLNGHIASIYYYPQRLINDETQATSK